TFAGREADVDELFRLLKLRQPLVCVHSPSGAGKSSVLNAGLIPRLAAERIPCAIDAHPDEPGLAARLITAVSDAVLRHGDSDWPAFVEQLMAIRLAANVPPVFVIDQFETVFRHSERQQVLVRLGPLLACTFQRVAQVDGPLCCWVLAYRQDFHGE